MRIGTAVAAAAAAWWLGACATELDGSDPSEQPNAQAQTDGFRFIVPYVDHPAVELPASSVPEDPCDCPDHACVDAWAETELACDVCVVLLCDEEWHPHVCHHC